MGNPPHFPVKSRTTNFKMELYEWHFRVIVMTHKCRAVRLPLHKNKPLETSRARLQIASDRLLGIKRWSLRNSPDSKCKTGFVLLTSDRIGDLP